MSRFVRNLVLRAAGLAPAAAPVKKPVFEEPALDVAEPEERTIQPQLRVEEERVAPVKARETRQAAPVVPVVSVVKPHAVERPVSPPPRIVREVVLPRVEAPATAMPALEVAPEVRMEVHDTEMRQAGRPALPALMERAVVAETAPVVETVREREVVFVEAPPLPPQILRQVEERVMESVPPEAARVDVHIGRVEIVQPAPPPPPAPRPRREPRGFADHRLERNYLNRRWY